MHAGLILFLWGCGVASVQLLDGHALLLLTVAALLLALVAARVRIGRLIRRVRVLFLAIILLFAWFTPGEALLVAWPSLSPTREGVGLALTHGARLLVVMCCVAMLLQHLPTDRLVSGLHALFRPLRFSGLPTERLALRLMLVLRYVDDARGGRHDWRTWLMEEGELQAPVHLSHEYMGWRDGLVLAGLIAVIGWWAW